MQNVDPSARRHGRQDTLGVLVGVEVLPCCAEFEVDAPVGGVTGQDVEGLRPVDQPGRLVKAQRWRGAIWVDAGIPWLVAAGWREEGSPDDFYASLAARGKTARARYNAEHSPPLTSTTYIADLLPGRDDDLRWRAETAVRTERRLRAVVHDLVRQSLLDGHEHAAMLDGAALGVQVLAEQGHETYVAIRIIGSVPRQLVATVLSLIPGCELDAWMSDYAMPERAVAPEEQIWSNIMDPVAAAKFLDQQS